MRRIYAIVTSAMLASGLAAGTLPMGTLVTAAAAETDAGTSTATAIDQNGNKITCPKGWNSDDPGWVKAYQQKYGTTEENTQSQSSSDKKMSALSDSVKTTWKLRSGSTATYYHDSRNTDGASIIPVIDVSKWDGTINWSRVAASGVKGVIIRCAYRGTGSGTIQEDPNFYSYIKGASEAGLKVGVYIFSQAVNTKEAQDEADKSIQMIKKSGYSLQLPVVTDIEYNGTNCRLQRAGLSKSAQTNIAKAFCKEVKDAGYTPMVYANSTYMVSHMNTSALASDGDWIWMARYNNRTYSGGSAFYQGAVDLWQCSENASVSGINTAVDLNYWYSSKKKNSSDPGSNDDPAIVSAKVSGLKKASATQKSVTVNWDKTGGADGYEVFYSWARNGSYQSAGTTTKTSDTISGLNEGQEYYIRVRPYAISDGEKIYGQNSSILSVTTGTDDSIRIQTKANMKMRAYAGSAYSQTGSVPSGTVLNRMAVALDKGGTEWNKVTYRGKTGYICTAKSYAGIYVEPVRTLKESSFSSSSIGLKWNASSDADYYRIFRSASRDGSYKKVKTLKASKTSYTDRKLEKGTEYYYKIRPIKKINKKNYFGNYSGIASFHTKSGNQEEILVSKKTALRQYAGSSYRKLTNVAAGTKTKAEYVSYDTRGNSWYHITVKDNSKNVSGYVKTTATSAE